MHVVVSVGHHCPAAVPTPLPNDVHASGIEGVRIAYDGSDVEIVLPVLDRDMHRSAGFVEVRNDCLASPIAVPVNHVAAIALGEELEVEVIALGPGKGMRADADFGFVVVGGRGVHPCDRTR